MRTFATYNTNLLNCLHKMKKENTQVIFNNHIDSLAEKIENLILESRQKVVSAVNITMVYTYYEIGRHIVEDEQEGEIRAEYGKAVLKGLASRLTKRFGKGYSTTNLKQMRQLFLSYAKSQTMSDLLQNGNNQTIEEIPSFTLSWSHYLKLMRISNPEERRFYEIEATNNKWSLKELERQYNSSLYERLALSRNKEDILNLSQQGQLIEKPQDLLKDPYILEFTGLPELLLCADKENSVIEYTLPQNNNQIFAAKYETVLPSKEELKNLIE